uniref:Uncharacterized protein n=1 Tax=Micrurus lemniscatus lemniscatus TaxID=129467 RepID=A0A2D4I1M7_MICLE
MYWVIFPSFRHFQKAFSDPHNLLFWCAKEQNCQVKQCTVLTGILQGYTSIFFAFNIQVIIQHTTLTFFVVLQNVKIISIAYICVCVCVCVCDRKTSHTVGLVLPSNAQKEFSLQQAVWPLNKTVSSTVIGT